MNRKFVFQTENGIWRILLLCSVLYIMSDMLGTEGVASVCFAGIYACLVVYMFFAIRRKYFSKTELILLMAIFFVALLNVMVGAKSFSFDYFKKLVLFIATVVMMITATKFNPNEKTVSWYKMLYQILAVIIFYKTFVSIELYGTTNFYSLGLPNSNIAGMWIFLVFAVLLWEYVYQKKRIQRLVLMFELVLLVYSCVMTGCRSALVLVICLTILFLFFIKTKTYDKLLMIGAIFLPVIFPWIYLGLYEANFSVSIFQSKSLFSGRQILWKSALEYVKVHPFRGVYYEISGGTGQSQMHNIFIDVLASYGVIVVILVWILLCSVVFIINKKTHLREQHVIFYAFLLTLVGGTFEAAFFSGGSGIGIASCMFLTMINYYNGQTESKKENLQ